MIAKTSVSGSIAFWINSYNENTHNSESSFYRYDTTAEETDRLNEFFETVMSNVERLTGSNFNEISSIAITTHNEKFNDSYYNKFRQEHPNLNILSMHLE